MCLDSSEFDSRKTNLELVDSFILEIKSLMCLRLSTFKCRLLSRTDIFHLLYEIDNNQNHWLFSTTSGLFYFGLDSQQCLKYCIVLLYNNILKEPECAYNNTQTGSEE